MTLMNVILVSVVLLRDDTQKTKLKNDIEKMSKYKSKYKRNKKVLI